MNAEQLIRELIEVSIRRCKHCVDNKPMGDDKLAFHYMHVGNHSCNLLKTEYDIIKRAEAYLMDGK